MTLPSCRRHVHHKGITMNMTIDISCGRIDLTFVAELTFFIVAELVCGRIDLLPLYSVKCSKL